MERLYGRLGCCLAGVFAAGLAVIVVVTAYQLLFPCPDFTDSQSGYAADATWILFPPGPRCDMNVRLSGDVQGLHTDWPSFFRIFALICWLGWMGSLISVRRHLRRAGVAGSQPTAQVAGSSSEALAADHPAADGQ